MMRISVVIPLYNKQPYIHRAIESVLEQQILPAEIIVIDDGSTDNGAQVVRAFSDPHLRLVQQPNAGECAARNRGIAEAKSPFIAFLDADDEWKPEFLAKIRILLDKFPECGAYATSAEIIRADGSTTYPCLSGVPSEPWIGIIPDFFELFQFGYAFNASSIVIPKRVLEEVGCFPEGVTVSGDVACWVNIAIRYPIAFCPTRSVIYHQEAENRAGVRYGLLKQMPYIETIRSAVESGMISGDRKSSALEFMAQKQIMVAIENIMAGNSRYGRNLLASCRSTKKYKRDWLWWRMWASLPAGWPKRLLMIKQMILRQPR